MGIEIECNGDKKLNKTRWIFFLECYRERKKVEKGYEKEDGKKEKIKERKIKRKKEIMKNGR